ncbi:hypothetical protein NDU88_001198 [Pleurodeles waltl]|uniref:Uncharacterized protein n=1 Tax=Pleurodeles waltl TaxID=8319 RepID=A0AAV7RAA3_PLEWA|nr:hypothetical protein NDU88_001198 [Pleurodeles waltl]
MPPGTSRGETGHGAVPLPAPDQRWRTRNFTGLRWWLWSGPVGSLGSGRRLRRLLCRAERRVCWEASTLRGWRQSGWECGYDDWALGLQLGACGERSLQVRAPAGPTGDFWLGLSRGERLEDRRRLLGCRPGCFC